jgi:hypothetical protein
MKYRMIGTDPASRREVSALSLGAMLMGSRTGEATSFARPAGRSSATYGRTRADAGRVLAAAARQLRPVGRGPAARAAVRPPGDGGAAFGFEVGGVGHRGDGQPGGAGMADGRGYR